MYVKAEQIVEAIRITLEIREHERDDPNSEEMSGQAQGATEILATMTGISLGALLGILETVEISPVTVRIMQARKLIEHAKDHGM